MQEITFLDNRFTHLRLLWYNISMFLLFLGSIINLVLRNLQSFVFRVNHIRGLCRIFWLSNRFVIVCRLLYWLIV